MNRREFIALLGGAATALLRTPAASAQELGRTYRIGGLSVQPRTARHWVAMFEELRRAGFVEGQNLAARGWELRVEQFPEVAAELVRAKVDVILSAGDPATRAAQRATATIPILAVSDDLVGSGLVPSLAHHGGNTTGVTIIASDLDAKRLEVLHDYVPRARRIAVLADPTTASTRAQIANAALDLGIEVVRFEARSPRRLASCSIPLWLRIPDCTFARSNKVPSPTVLNPLQCPWMTNRVWNVRCPHWGNSRIAG
jgi:putative tryptophan/tyrosine transport system substrate-binding protein